MSYNNKRIALSKKDCNCTGCKKSIKRLQKVTIIPKQISKSGAIEVYCTDCRKVD